MRADFEMASGLFQARPVSLQAIADVTAALRWRISPRWSTCLDFLAQMNLVASMLSQSRWAT